jgi:hypothetical protein
MKRTQFKDVALHGSNLPSIRFIRAATVAAEKLVTTVSNHGRFEDLDSLRERACSRGTASSR